MDTLRLYGSRLGGPGTAVYVAPIRFVDLGRLLYMWDALDATSQSEVLSYAGDMASMTGRSQLPALAPVTLLGQSLVVAAHAKLAWTPIEFAQRDGMAPKLAYVDLPVPSYSALVRLPAEATDPPAGRLLVLDGQEYLEAVQLALSRDTSPILADSEVIVRIFDGVPMAEAVELARHIRQFRKMAQD